MTHFLTAEQRRVSEKGAFKSANLGKVKNLSRTSLFPCYSSLEVAEEVSTIVYNVIPGNEWPWMA